MVDDENPDETIPDEKDDLESEDAY